MFQMSNDICLLPDNSVEGLAASFFCLIHEKGGKEMERPGMWLWERSGCTTLLLIAVFFLFLGANGVGWLGRYYSDFGEWLVIQTWTGRVLSKFTVLLSQLRLFWLEIWKLRMVLDFFSICWLFFWFLVGDCAKWLIYEKKNNSRIKGQCQTRG